MRLPSTTAIFIMTKTSSTATNITTKVAGYVCRSPLNPPPQQPYEPFYSQPDTRGSLVSDSPISFKQRARVKAGPGGGFGVESPDCFS